MSDEDLAVTLADLALDAATTADSPEMSDALVRTLLDWFAVAVGGSAAPAASALLAGLGSDHGDVRILGASGRFASVETAALIHGTAAHALELDDIYAPGLYHPGAPTIAAALAAAERFDTTGAQLMRGIIAGIEVGCRVAADLGAQHYVHWHSTGTAGAIGAAVAAAVVRDASRDQIAQAIAIAGTMAAGLQQTFRRDGGAKPVHAGHAAQSGIVAAFGAIEGLTGALDILEGPSGLAVATGVETNWDACRAPLGRTLCVENLTVKPYPCCGHSFAAIDAARALRQRGVRSAEVSSVLVETYSTAVATAGIIEPQKASEARFSIPYVVAISLADGNVTQSSFAEGRLWNPEARRLLPLTSLRTHDEFDQVFPARRGARVTVELTSGESLTATEPNRLGSPENPISTEALTDKFDDLVVPVLGHDRSRHLHAALAEVMTLPSVRAIPLTR